jgi:hypothetical protein
MTARLFAPDLARELAQQWGKGPRVYREALGAPAFTDREFMQGILGTAREHLANPGAAVPPGRVFVGQDVVPAEKLGPFLPASEDETFAAYVERIRRAHPEDEVGIILDNCERYVPSVRETLTPLLHGLFAQVGYPARPNHACIYAGTYKTTPFGIHRDDCHVIMFCGIGRKTLAFWPRPYFETRRELFQDGKLRARLEDHVHAAEVLSIGPRDLLYWPAEHWHVAVSETLEFQAALSIGIYHQGSSTEKLRAFDFIAALGRVESLDLHGLPAPSNGRLKAGTLEGTSLGPFFERWKKLGEVFARADEAAFRALEMTLRSASSAGYGKRRGTGAPTPALTAELQLRCPVPESLVTAEIRGGLMVGANGSVFFYPRGAAAIAKAFARVRSSGAASADALIADTDAALRSCVSSALEDALGAGALQSTWSTAPTKA